MHVLRRGGRGSNIFQIEITLFMNGPLVIPELKYNLIKNSANSNGLLKCLYFCVSVCHIVFLTWPHFRVLLSCLLNRDRPDLNPLDPSWPHVDCSVVKNKLLKL